MRWIWPLREQARSHTVCTGQPSMSPECKHRSRWCASCRALLRNLVTAAALVLPLMLEKTKNIEPTRGSTHEETNSSYQLRCIDAEQYGVAGCRTRSVPERAHGRGQLDRRDR